MNKGQKDMLELMYRYVKHNMKIIVTRKQVIRMLDVAKGKFA